MESNQVDKEFNEMKERYENFIRPLKRVCNIKENVFYHIVNEKRTKESMMEIAQETRPFMAKEVWNLLEDFMEFMRNVPGEEGMNYRLVYEGFTPADLVKRLLTKRPLVFYAAQDRFMLRFNGSANIEGSNGALELAKTLDNQSSGNGYCLKEYISYDENLLSSLISMSTPTFYVSDGSIKKVGTTSKKPYIESGILCGLVGARNKKISFMENRFINPRNEKGWTAVHLSDDFWTKKVYADAFPEGFIPTHEHVENNRAVYGMIYVDGFNVVYLEKRLMFSIIPYIREAAARGREKQVDIFCSVPPIGGGVWRGKIKEEIILDTIVKGVLKFLDQEFDYQEMKKLKAFALPKTDLRVYSYFKASKNIQSIHVNSDEQTAVLKFKEPQNHTIKIYNQFRYVAEPLPDEFKNCLSIAAYAWDGNSYPGNEYWCGLMGSFDPQAIYCSLLGQFQNPEVNVHMADADRIRIY